MLWEWEKSPNKSCICLASGDLGGGERKCQFCSSDNIATTTTKAAPASCCPFAAGNHKKNIIFEKSSSQKAILPPSIRVKMYGRPCLSLEHHSRNRTLLPVPELQKAKRLRILLALAPLYSHRRLLLLLHTDKCMQCLIKNFGPFPEYL